MQHFHEARYSMLPFPTSAHVGISVNADSLFLGLYESRANIWLAEALR